MIAARRAALLAGVTAVVGALLVGAALWPVLGPLTQRTPLPAAVRSTDAGVPVPATAERCPEQNLRTPSSVRWCMPGVSPRTLQRWYDDVLPAGHDQGNLRWCVEQRRADGTRRALWSTDAGLVGYAIPVERRRAHAAPDGDVVAVEVVVLQGSSCHPATRASREQP